MDGQAAHVHPQLPHRARHIPGHAAEARAVVGDRDVIVHGLGDAHDPDALLPAGCRQLAAGVHGSIAAVHQHIADVFLRQNVRHALVVLRLQGIPGGADRGGRSALELLQLLSGHRIELQQVPLQEPAGAPHCAVDAVHFPAVQRLRHRAIQRTVQNSGGTPAVDNDQISLHCPSSSQQRLVPFPAFHSRRAQLTWEYCTITVGIGQG